MFENEAERQRFEKFYESMYRKCLHMAMSVTKNRVLAEDAVQEAFLKYMYKKEKYFSLPCNKQEALIVIMVKNKAIDILRKQKIRVVDIVDEYGDEILADGVNIETDYVTDESYKRLLSLVETLPDIYKNVFYMKYVLELNNGEIAEMLEITKDTVAVGLNRAKEKIKEKILKGGESIGY